MAPPNTINGMRVVLEPNFVSERHPRTWKERLWSWPWKPWISVRTVPSNKIVQYGDHTLIMHPQTFIEAKKILGES